MEGAFYRHCAERGRDGLDGAFDGRGAFVQVEEEFTESAE